MKFMNLFVAAGLALVSSNIQANELDPVAQSLPRQLVVKIDEKTGAQTVYKAFTELKVTSDKDAAVVAGIAETGGQAVEVQPLNELDRDSSQAAWCYYYQPNYWNYNYGYSYYYYGYQYSYSSYYYYRSSGYNYHYYWY